MATKMKGLFKGLKYIGQIFEEENKDGEIQIGFPTDVKHVAHIGWDGQSPAAADANPSWMKGFKSEQAGSQSSPLDSNGNNIESPEIPKKEREQQIQLEGTYLKFQDPQGAITHQTTIITQVTLQRKRTHPRDQGIQGEATPRTHPKAVSSWTALPKSRASPALRPGATKKTRRKKSKDTEGGPTRSRAKDPEGGAPSKSKSKPATCGKAGGEGPPSS